MHLIRIFAMLILVLTLYGLWSLRLFLLAVFTGSPVPNSSMEWAELPGAIFLVTASAFQLAVGIGVLAGTRWAYWLLRGWLYVWLVAFPIGTLIAWPLLRRLRRDDVRQQFGLGPLLA